MREIQLTQGKAALVSDEDFPRVAGLKWYAQRQRDTWYAANKGRAGKIYMHRLILTAPTGQECDHANGDGLDNRRRNLRLCTRAENQRNRRIPRGDKSSRFKGVSWSETNRAWKATIRMHGKERYLGLYDREDRAAVAYNRAARNLFGRFARTNPVGEAANPERLRRHARGERSPLAKLTETDVRAIRVQAERGESYSVIGRRFDCAPQNVRFIVNRKTWKHVA